jgi:hypothetical protein
VTSKAKYEFDPKVAESCKKECAELLARHPLYPEIDL